MSAHPSRRMLAGFFGGLLALTLACGSPGAARLNLGGGSSPPTEPRGELRIGLGGEPDTLDPNFSGDARGATVIAELFEPLIKGREGPTSWVPAAAREVPTRLNGGVSEDGLTYTFSIRDGAVWSDGRPLVAEDFVYSIKRQLDPRNPQARSLRALGAFDIKGSEAYATAFESDDATLALLREAVGARATGPSTLVLQLTRPSSLRPALLPWPVRRDVVEANAGRWAEPEHFVGNGPFLLTEWVRGDHITLVPNPLYQGDKPRVAKLTFLTRGSGADWRAFQSGQLDLVAVPAGSRAAALSDPTLASQLMRYPAQSTAMVLFNVTRSPFEDVRVRQALARAVDRVELVKEALEGVGVPATSIIPPGVAGHNPELGKSVQGFDPVAARRLLAEAGFPDGRGFPILSLPFSADNDTLVARASFVARAWAANLGVPVTPEPLSRAAWAARLETGDFSVTFRGYTPPPDPEAYLRIFQSINAINPGNSGGYRNPAYDRAFDLFVREMDPARRLDRLHEAERLMVEDSPRIFLYYEENLWLRQPYVRDLGVTPGGGEAMPGRGELSKVWIEKK